MQTCSICRPTAQHCGTVHVALELSQKEWLVTVHSPDKQRMSRHRVAAGDSDALLALIVRVRDRAARAVGQGVHGA